MQMINALVQTQHKSAISNFWPQLQILEGSADHLTRPSWALENISEAVKRSW